MKSQIYEIGSRPHPTFKGGKVFVVGYKVGAQFVVVAECSTEPMAFRICENLTYDQICAEYDVIKLQESLWRWKGIAIGSILALFAVVAFFSHIIRQLTQ